MKKIGIVLLICLIIGGVIYEYNHVADKEYTKNTLLMDTVITLRASGKNAKTAVDESIDRLKEIDKMASATNPDSDITKINTAAGDAAVKVHPEITKMVQASIQYSKLTDGSFDITVGPLINLWGIGTDKQCVPNESEIRQKLAFVGYDRIELDDKANSIRLKDKGMAIDLGAVAKGFATDEVLSIYQKHQIKNGLISLGSSTVYALGKNSNGDAWTIGIVNPRDENSENYLGIIRLTNEAISTSGDYERYFIQDGKRYHHILNPKTGYPADAGVMSTTLIVSNTVKDKGMISDILSTAVFILGKDKGLELMQKIDGVSGEITTTDKRLYTTPGFDKRIEELNSSYKMN
jgi:thiamine biosynthesis lipoprotein